MLDRRTYMIGLGTLALIGTFGVAQAHHGWAWAENENVEMTGTIISAKLGNPHGLLKVNINGEEWTVEVGQPWRNARAGLKDSMLVKGVELTIQGHRAKDRKLRVLKAERVIIKGKTYDLYPDRA